MSHSSIAFRALRFVIWPKPRTFGEIERCFGLAEKRFGAMDRVGSGLISYRFRTIQAMLRTYGSSFRIARSCFGLIDCRVGLPD